MRNIPLSMMDSATAAIQRNPAQKKRILHTVQRYAQGRLTRRRTMEALLEIYAEKSELLCAVYGNGRIA